MYDYPAAMAMWKAVKWAAKAGEFADPEPHLGRVRLLDDEDAFGHAVNWDVLKLAKCGKECRVSKVFPDRTFLAVFDHGAKQELLFLPWGVAVHGEQVKDLGEPGSPPMHVTAVHAGRVRLLEDIDDFRHAFARFEYDSVNGFSVEKLAYRGELCRVSKTYREDKTFVAVFANGKVYTFPWEAVAEQTVIF